MKHRLPKTISREVGQETEVEVIEYVPTEDDMQLLLTNPLKGAAARDVCGDGTLEYRHNSPLAIWKTFPVKYAFEISVSQDLRDGINRSFDVYNSLKPGFFAHGTLSDSRITIKVAPIDSSGQTLARANWSYSTSSLSLTKGAITFDSNETWRWLGNESCGSNGSTYDIGNIAVHEIGHLVGLSHAPTDTLQTMYATTAPGKTIGRTLGNGDIEGIRKAYNLPITPEPTPTPDQDWTALGNRMKESLTKLGLELEVAWKVYFDMKEHAS